MTKLRLSHSQLAVARECARKYRFKYVQLREPMHDSGSLSFGRLWHEVLERWWLHGYKVALTWLATEGVNKLTAPDGRTEAVGAKLAAMLAHYRPPLERWEVNGVEQAFTIPIVNPTTGHPLRVAELYMIVDAVVTERSTGETWLVEHKTTSDDITGFGPYWQRLSLDHQVAIYLLGTGAAGVVYDVARKPGLKLCGKDEQAAQSSGDLPSNCYQRRLEAEIGANLDSYYQVREIRKTAEDLVEAQWDIYHQALLLHEQLKHGRFPRNPNACRGLYGTCPYLSVCVGDAQLEDDSMFRDRERRAA